MAKHPYALQLYTVRDHLATNVPDTLKQVKKIGYDNVEIADLAGLPPEEFKKYLKDAGVRAISVTVTFEQLTASVATVMELARVFDVKFVAVGTPPSTLVHDKAGWFKCAKILDTAGAQLRQAGIQLCYHNRTVEFQWLEGDMVLDLLLKNSSPDNLKIELDTFWAQYAGAKPITILEKLTGRCPLLHVKDMLDSKSGAFAEMGEGILKWDDIFKAAEQAGVEHYIVEQDACARDSMESARISALFMAQH